MEIKYLYSSFRYARKKKLSSEYLFYLQLQSIGFKQNEMFKGDLIRTIQKHTNYSPASISQQIKQLVKTGFIKEYKHASTGKEWKYVIKSYRKVWNLLGFRFSDNYVNRHKFELIDITRFRDKKSMKALVLTLELKHNREKQIFTENQTLQNKIEYHESTLNTVKSSKIRERKETTLKHLKNTLKQNSKNDLLGRCKELNRNKISCEKVVSIMGHKSQVTATNLTKNAESLGLLSVQREKALIAEGVSKIEFSIRPEFQGCYWVFGKVYKKECNVYTFHSIDKSALSSNAVASRTL